MKLFIGCSANENIPQNITKDCEKLLKSLLKDNDLVFGACHTGIMGISYKIAKENKRKVTGICPKFYAEEFTKLQCDEEIITDNMLDSTLKIYENSDVIIMLPGGIGTIYEFFTAIQSKRSQDHHLPIILYNSCGYYNYLITFINKMEQDNFIDEETKKEFYIVSSLEEINKIIGA